MQIGFSGYSLLSLVPMSMLKSGGGAGIRINVRGFNQRNVAVMINGIPVNDMKMAGFIGLIGMVDVTSSVQMQKGKCSEPYTFIGGSMNIDTAYSLNKRLEHGALKSTISYQSNHG